MLPARFLDKLSADAVNEGVQQFIVRAIVQHEDAVLLLRRPRDGFRGGVLELPGGKVDPGETLDQALVREVREETGLTVTGIRHHVGDVDYVSALNGRRIREFVFAVDIGGRGPVRLREHEDYEWAALHGQLPVPAELGEVLGRYRESSVSSRGSRPGR